MRPIHVVVLLLAGALGGAVIMKVTHPGKPVIPVVDVVQAQPPATAPPEQQAPSAQAVPVALAPELPAEVAVEPARPSPMPPPPTREISQPQRARRVDSVAALVLAATAHPAPPVVSPPVPAPPPPPPSPTIAPPPVDAEPEPGTPAPPQVSAAPVPQPHQVTLNAGVVLPVRLVDGLSSERNAPGDAFAATLDKELVVDGFVIAERGARVEGRVVAVDRARPGGAAALALELTALHTSDGQTAPIRTESYFKHADPPQVNNTTKIAGGAMIGAAIGAIAGGGKGAAIGAGVGGGAGVGDVLLTRRPAELPAESLVTFRLKNPVPLTEQLR